MSSHCPPGGGMTPINLTNTSNGREMHVYKQRKLLHVREGVGSLYLAGPPLVKVRLEN